MNMEENHFIAGFQYSLLIIIYTNTLCNGLGHRIYYIGSQILQRSSYYTVTFAEPYYEILVKVIEFIPAQWTTLLINNNDKTVV